MMQRTAVVLAVLVGASVAQAGVVIPPPPIIPCPGDALTGADWTETFNDFEGNPGANLEASLTNGVGTTTGVLLLTLDSVTVVGSNYVSLYHGTLYLLDSFWGGTEGLTYLVTVDEATVLASTDPTNTLSCLSLSAPFNDFPAYTVILQADAIETYKDDTLHSGHVDCGTLCITPEPATMALMALGGLALLRRRRR